MLFAPNKEHVIYWL